MKKKIQIYIISFVISLVFLIPLSLSADPPPTMPGNHGTSNDQPPGGSAPIGSGLVLFITLSAAYGSKKVYGFKETK